MAMTVNTLLVSRAWVFKYSTAGTPSISAVVQSSPSGSWLLPLASLMMLWSQNRYSSAVTSVPSMVRSTVSRVIPAVWKAMSLESLTGSAGAPHPARRPVSSRADSPAQRNFFPIIGFISSLSFTETAGTGPAVRV